MAIDLQNLEKTPHLLDYLLMMEGILDDLDLYVYRNWVRGEVIEGPQIERHTVSMTLFYPEKHMPDPRGALRLLKTDITASFDRVRKEQDKAKPKEAQKEELEGGWEVKLTFPRRLFDEDRATTDWHLYGDRVEMDDVEDAQDSGISEEDAYQNEDNDETEVPPGLEAEPPNGGGGPF